MAVSHEHERTSGKFEPGDIVDAGELGRGLVMRYEEAARPLVAFPGMDELLICQDEGLRHVGRIEEIPEKRD
jgi:hypothetical protein